MQPPHYEWFIKVRTERFKHLKHARRTRQGQCLICLNVSDQLRAVPLGERHEALQELKRRHLRLQLNERTCYATRRALAKEHPELNFSVVADMSQGRPAPMTVQAAKDEKTVGVELIGLTNHSIQRSELHFARRDAWPKNINMLLSILHGHLLRCLRSGAPVGRTFFLQLDNTSSENKNHALLSYCGLLVELGYFDRVVVSFLIPGHTHEDIDRFFGTAKFHLRQMAADSPPDSFALLEKRLAASKMPTTCHELTDVWAFSPQLLDSFEYILEGISFPLSFYIARHGGAASPVTLKWREYSSVQLGPLAWKGTEDCPDGLPLLRPNAVAQLRDLEAVPPQPLEESVVAGVLQSHRIREETLYASPWWQRAMNLPLPGPPPPWQLPADVRQRLQARPSAAELPLVLAVVESLEFNERQWSRIVAISLQLFAKKKGKERLANSFRRKRRALAADPAVRCRKLRRLRRGGEDAEAEEELELDVEDELVVADSAEDAEDADSDDEDADGDAQQAAAERRAAAARSTRATRSSGLLEQRIVREYYPAAASGERRLWYIVEFGPADAPAGQLKMQATSVPEELVAAWRAAQESGE